MTAASKQWHIPKLRAERRKYRGEAILAGSGWSVQMSVTPFGGSQWWQRETPWTRRFSPVRFGLRFSSRYEGWLQLYRLEAWMAAQRNSKGNLLRLSRCVRDCRVLGSMGASAAISVGSWQWHDPAGEQAAFSIGSGGTPRASLMNMLKSAALFLIFTGMAVAS